MYYIIEYVDTFTGVAGEALSWEFAKTEDEACIKARAHFLLFKARFGAQGYRILCPEGSLIACGPGNDTWEAAMPKLVEKRDDRAGPVRITQIQQKLEQGCRRIGPLNPSAVVRRDGGQFGSQCRVSFDTHYGPTRPRFRMGNHVHRIQPPLSTIRKANEVCTSEEKAVSGLGGRGTLPEGSFMPKRLSSIAISREMSIAASQQPAQPTFIEDLPVLTRPTQILSGKRILVVEDEGLIALDIMSELRRAGCTAIGPALRLETAMTLAAAQKLDAAVLDVFLEGAYSWQLAGTLQAQGVPFLFQTAFGRALEFPAAFATIPRLEKPLGPDVLRRELSAILETPRQIRCLT